MKKTPLKWWAVVGGACLGAAVASPKLARSADHLDSPAAKAESAADINDLYTFVDGDRAVFAMTVFPAAPAGAKFSDAIVYAFHTASAGAFGTTTQDVDILCTFDAAQKASCWAGDAFASGDASQGDGIASSDGKLRVFAGLRKDPFFFNLEGFLATVDAVKGAVDAGAVTADGTGCPDLSGGTGAALRALLQKTDGGAPVDFFKDLDTLAIVVSVDKSLVTKAGPIVSVWASTNKKQ